MPNLWEVQLRIAVAEGVITKAEADALAEEFEGTDPDLLKILVERGRLSEGSMISIAAAVRNDPGVIIPPRDASASTYTMHGPPPPPSKDPPFPVASWDRYTEPRFLGQGGMGIVFRAFDARLQRRVAIKFVRGGDDPDNVQRLIREARAQAKLHHPRICEIYEANEVEGKVYLAMQYIDGAPLGKLAGELTIEQKVLMVRHAAEALHVAHAEGIIHRDIKPSNIMVERDQDGELRPYVMDFGLARLLQDPGTTVTGALLGTPRYMSPEQARGIANLDRRADVYSLGATLYQLVTGHPPVAGDNHTEILVQLETAEILPLRFHDRSIPVDLEAVVLKCLERDRAERYETARALVEDLDRFLNGDPVVARPTGTWYRLRKRIAKHRRLVALGAIGFTALAVAVGWAIKTSGDSSERERLAREFTERVERIESDARYSALSPRHDIAADRDDLRTSMRKLEADIQRAGDIAVGPGNYAQGRGFLALGDDDKARSHLALAWNAGFQEPRVAYALAQVMGRVYSQQLLAAEAVIDELAQEREAKKREIGWRYRDPALGFLARASQGGAEVPPQDYLAALVAFYEERFDDALAGLDAYGGAHWFYEVPKLRGDILLARALGARGKDAGDRRRRDLEAARAAYTMAAAIGRSVLDAHRALGELEADEIELVMYGEGAGDTGPPFGRAIAATAEALAIVPDHYETLVLEAKVLRRRAEDLLTNHNTDANDLLDRARTAASRAIAATPTRVEARLELAQIHRQRGDVRRRHHDDPSVEFGEAISVMDRIPLADRDAAYYRARGLIFTIWAEYLDEVGAESAATRQHAIDALQTALQYVTSSHKELLLQIWTDLGTVWLSVASLARGQQADDALDHSIDALAKAITYANGNIVPYVLSGRAYDLKAQRVRARGGNPEPALEQARDVFGQALRLKPDNQYIHNGLGAVHQNAAYASWQRGEDPEPALEQALAAFQDAIHDGPKDPYGYDNVGEALLQRAAFERARGEDPRASVDTAIASLQQAIKLDSNYATFPADLAMAHALRAAYQLDHGGDPRAAIADAAAAVVAALDRNASDPTARLELAEMLALRARFAAAQGRGRTLDFIEAASAFQQAIAVAPENQDYQLAFGEFCRQSAIFYRETAGDPAAARAAVERGHDLVDSVVKLRPQWADPLALRAALHVVAAQLERDASAQRTHAKGAVNDFSAAFAIRRALENAWKRQLEIARQLAAG